MARGYELHARILGSRLGKRLAPSAEKERARPLFLEGRWGRFERVLDDAVARSVPVLESVWTAFEASDRDAEPARAALDELLPGGTIEGQGLDIDLDQPFVVLPAGARPSRSTASPTATSPPTSAAPPSDASDAPTQRCVVTGASNEIVSEPPRSTRPALG